jgi:hypothetical protein
MASRPLLTREKSGAVSSASQGAKKLAPIDAGLAKRDAFFSFARTPTKETLFGKSAPGLLPPPKVEVDSSLHALGKGTIFDPSRDTYMAPMEKLRYLKPADAQVSRVMTSDVPFQSGSLRSFDYGSDEPPAGDIATVFGNNDNDE